MRSVREFAAPHCLRFHSAGPPLVFVTAFEQYAPDVFEVEAAFARPGNVVEVQRMGRTINALVLRDGAIVQVGPNYAKAVAERLGLTA